MPFVAIKMGRRQGARRAHPAPFLRWGEKLKSAGLQKWCGMLVARALKNSQLTCGERHAISGTGH
jgi:hypothetical protein